jgi:Holliday junction resolvasome RuvABC endonuclease subunit
MRAASYAVLGVDPSLTHTAVHRGASDEDGSLERFEMRGALTKGSGKSAKQIHLHALARLAFLEDEFRHFIMTVPNFDTTRKYMFIEGYAMGAKFNREALGELGGVLRLAAFRNGWNIVVVAPTALKKFVTKGGKADKNAMMMHCLDAFGYKATDDDDCDAYCLMRLGQAYINYKIGATPRIDTTWKAVFAELKVIRASALIPDLATA